MKMATLISGILMVVLGIFSLIFYDHYWSPKRQAETMLREAILIAERKTPEATNDALKILTSIYAKYQELPVASRALMHIGLAYEKLGLNESALEKYNFLKSNARGLNRSEQDLISKRIAHIQILRNYSDEAVSQLYQLLSRSTDMRFRSQIYTELGMLYYKEGQLKKALNAYSIAEKEYGHNRNATLGKAQVLKALGDHDQAFGIYQGFLKYGFEGSDESKEVSFHFRNQAYQRGRESLERKSYWQAVRYFRIVLDKFPASQEASQSLYWIAEAYFGLGKFYPAIEYFKRVAVLDKHDKKDDALFKLGESYFELKKFEIAAKYFNDIIRYYPGSSYFNLAKEWKEQCENEILSRMKSSQRNVPLPEERTFSNQKDETDISQDEPRNHSAGNTKVTAPSGKGFTEL